MKHSERRRRSGLVERGAAIGVALLWPRVPLPMGCVSKQQGGAGEHAGTAPSSPVLPGLACRLQRTTAALQSRLQATKGREAGLARAFQGTRVLPRWVFLLPAHCNALFGKGASHHGA